MGREIRRVPANWEHPTDERGRYRPLYDEDFATAAREWLNACIAWDKGTAKEFEKHPEYKNEYPFYWQYDGNPPDAEYYRPAWGEGEVTHYQIYENVSEGTPVSPVFATLDEMKVWLLSQGFSDKASSIFIKDGYAPSAIFMPGRGLSGVGIDSLDFLP